MTYVPLRTVERVRPSFGVRQDGRDLPDDRPDILRPRPAGIEVAFQRGLLPHPDFLKSPEEVAVALAPQALHRRGRSFGKILGYVNARVPILCSDAADHAPFFRSETGLESNDAAAWADRAAQWLADPAERQEVADAAYGDFVEGFSIEAGARRTGRFPARLLEGQEVPA